MATEQTKMPTFFAAKITGNLGHDANVFDRTCPKCKGMYYSLMTPACPKCGGPLTYMTTGKGKPMSITECSFYPIFGEETEKKWEADTAKRKGGMGITWRFKIFNYADKNGVLADHPMSMMLKKGATIELRVYNHPPFATEYVSTKFAGRKMVEMMFVVYPNYGDSIKVIKQPAVATKVDAQGNAVPPTLISTATPVANAELIAAITAQVVASLTGKAAIPVVEPAPKVVATAQPKTAVAASAEEDIDEQVLGSLYGDIEAEAMDDFPEHTASLANVNPWDGK
jgi:hypothetical protein